MDAIIDGLLDTLKLMPYLLITFIVLELIEHKLSKKNQELLSKKGNKGKVVLGGLLGALPQCGFSAVGANLFSSRVITMGTLIAVFLSTSDEMLPIMISEHTKVKELLTIIVFKVIIGIVVGLIVDLIYKRKETNEEIKDICESDHCDCNHRGIVVGALIHTLKTALFILIANLLINIVIYFVGEKSLKNLLLHKNIFTYFLASLIGLIPNCAASVVITEVYLSGLITIGTLISGLLTGSGLGILLLFKTNKNMKENLSILGIIYFVGVIVGLIVDLLV